MRARAAGGIMKCDVIAAGIVAAAKEVRARGLCGGSAARAPRAGQSLA